MAFCNFLSSTSTASTVGTFCINSAMTFGENPQSQPPKNSSHTSASALSKALRKSFASINLCSFAILHPPFRLLPAHNLQDVRMIYEGANITQIISHAILANHYCTNLKQPFADTICPFDIIAGFALWQFYSIHGRSSFDLLKGCAVCRSAPRPRPGFRLILENFFQWCSVYHSTLCHLLPSLNAYHIHQLSQCGNISYAILREV